MDQLFRRSPLERYRTGNQLAAVRCNGLLIEEQTHCGKFKLRVHGGEHDVSGKLAPILGTSLPLVANSVNTGTVTAAWLGPGKWMIICQDTQVEYLCRQIRNALADTVCIVADYSEAMLVIRISGENARAMIAKACALDLRSSEFAPGHCAGSLFARTPVLIHQVDAAPSFDLFVDSSLADYIWRWLGDASLEFAHSQTAFTDLQATP